MALSILLFYINGFQNFGKLRNITELLTSFLNPYFRLFDYFVLNVSGEGIPFLSYIEI